MSWGDPVTVVNRTSKTLEFTFDGHSYKLKPGDNYGIVASLAEFAKRKLPIMGTENYNNPTDYQCLVGVKEWDDPIFPIEQSDAIERLDRKQLDGVAQRATAVAPKGGVYRPMGGDIMPQNHVEFAGGAGVGA